MPFAVRQLGMPKAKLGMSECITQQMVYTYPVTYERPTDMVAGYRFTAIVRAGKTTCLTAAPIEVSAAVAAPSPLAGTEYAPVLARSNVPKSFSW
jgi:hypothetical protein